MPAFIVTFDDVAFRSGHVDTDSLEMSEQEALGFTETAVKEGTLPKGVLAVVDVRASIDDSAHTDGMDAEGDVKVFVSVRLKVEADSLEAAEEFEAPVDLLTRLTDAVTTDLDFEGNWEVLDADPVDEMPRP